MKRMALSFLAVIFLAAVAHSAEEAVARAMKLYEKRHYEESAAALVTQPLPLEHSQQGATHLALGMIYLKNAELHRELYEESLTVAQDYLRKLAAGQGKDRSRFADLYLGEALIEAGKPAEAVAPLEKFAADESIDLHYRTLAQAELGLSYYLSGDKQKAESLWNGINSPNSEVRTELASVFARAGLKGNDPEALCEQSLAEAKKSGKSPTMRMVRNIISVYARAGLTDKGLDLLRRTDTKAYSYQEVLGKSKVISFYDLSLLGDLSMLYSQASVAHLEKALADTAVKDPAEYYLSSSYAMIGSADKSAKVAKSFIDTSRMPQKYKYKLKIGQAAILYRQGHRAEAAAVWTALSQEQPPDPDLLAEIVFSCARVKSECSQIVKKAVTIARTGQGRSYYALNFAVGRYYLMKKNQAKAIAYLEAGRDKSNKNKIESNDPLMLVDLAGLYYRSKKFSEALEIYFEMSKQFPQVRQIQESMQGVYAIEQKSAGDVKMF